MRRSWRLISSGRKLHFLITKVVYKARLGSSRYSDGCAFVTLSFPAEGKRWLGRFELLIFAHNDRKVPPFALNPRRKIMLPFHFRVQRSNHLHGNSLISIFARSLLAVTTARTGYLSSRSANRISPQFTSAARFLANLRMMCVRTGNSSVLGDSCKSGGPLKLLGTGKVFLSTNTKKLLSLWCKSSQHVATQRSVRNVSCLRMLKIWGVSGLIFRWKPCVQ